MDKTSISIPQFDNRPSPEVAFVLNLARVETLRPGSFFLSAGQVSHCAGYILEGVVRIYNLNEKGEERTLGFASEQSFVMDMESFKNRTPSLRNWEALTEVKILVWDREHMRSITERLPNWAPVVSDIVQKVLYDRTVELFEMLEDSATLRYQKFSSRYPQLLARVPLRHIANYLGIAPQSLSRIRQQLISASRKK